MPFPCTFKSSYLNQSIFCLQIISVTNPQNWWAMNDFEKMLMKLEMIKM